MPKTIKLDPAPLPVIAHELICPSCGMMLRRTLVRDFGFVYEHQALCMSDSECINEGRSFTITSDLRVNKIPRGVPMGEPCITLP